MRLVRASQGALRRMRERFRSKFGPHWIPFRDTTMSSWRDTASRQAQDDLDKLLNVVLEFAKRELATHGEFFPFGAGIDKGGRVEMLLAPQREEHPLAGDVLTATIRTLVNKRGTLRAAATGTNVRLGDGDAIQVDLESQEGPAITLILPYRKGRSEGGLEYDALRAATGHSRICV